MVVALILLSPVPAVALLAGLLYFGLGGAFEIGDWLNGPRSRR